MDILIINDVDTDEDCRNPDTIEKKWSWIEKALIGTRSISKPTLIIFLGNIIAEDCCVVRATKTADFVHVVNIRDEDGKSSWPQKNTEEHIDRVLSTISYNAQQQEYFNNPIDEGKVFKEMTYGKVPSMDKFRFLVVYADPSPSNRDRPSVKAKMQNSCKSVVICGCVDQKFYVLKCWVDHTTNSNFIDWMYAARNFIANRAQAYFFIENNTLQDPFYEQVFLPLIYERARAMKMPVLAITPDDRKKPDKYFRIEGNLEPLNRLGLLILNSTEKEDPHMQRLEAQFKSVSANSRTMDGPDAVEGGVHIIKNKISLVNSDSIKIYKKPANAKRY